MIRLFSLWLFLALFFSGCVRKDAADSPVEETPGSYQEITFPGARNPAEDAAYRERAVRLAASMDDRSLAAQVIMTGVEGKGALSGAMRRLLEEVPAGAVMLFSYNLDAERGEIRSLLGECSILIEKAGDGIPPFFAADHEGGAVHRFGSAAARLPAAASYWDMALREGAAAALREIGEDARRSGEELRDLGITMNLAPVAEVLNGENRLFLGERSYGPDPDFVGKAAAAFIGGMDGAGIFCVVKHFPGSGGSDPHRGEAALPGDRESLRRGTEPFAALIRGNFPGAVMVSHAVVPAWDGRRNASLSPAVIRRWIRGELGYTGMLLADDFSMAAVGMENEAAAAEALNAGIDMVMAWPENLRAVHRAILSAAEEGGLSGERLREAAGRVLFEKIKRGLIP